MRIIGKLMLRTAVGGRISTLASGPSARGHAERGRARCEAGP
jgi:hypothetical protein